jgi:hypothetical protein
MRLNPVFTLITILCLILIELMSVRRMVDVFILHRMDLIWNVVAIFVSLQAFADSDMTTAAYLLGVGSTSVFLHDDMRCHSFH